MNYCGIYYAFAGNPGNILPKAKELFKNVFMKAQISDNEAHLTLIRRNFTTTIKTDIS